MAVNAHLGEEVITTLVTLRTHANAEMGSEDATVPTSLLTSVCAQVELFTQILDL